MFVHHTRARNANRSGGGPVLSTPPHFPTPLKFGPLMALVMLVVYMMLMGLIDYKDTAAAHRVYLRRGRTAEVAARAGVSVTVVRRVTRALVQNWTAEAEAVRVVLIEMELCPRAYLPDRREDRERPWP